MPHRLDRTRQMRITEHATWDSPIYSRVENSKTSMSQVIGSLSTFFFNAEKFASISHRPELHPAGDAMLAGRSRRPESLFENGRLAACEAQPTRFGRLKPGYAITIALSLPNDFFCEPQKRFWSQICSRLLQICCHYQHPLGLGSRRSFCNRAWISR